MPRIPSSNSSKSKSSSSKSNSSRKSNRSKKTRKTVRKTVKRELKGKKIPVSQIDRIIAFQKKSDATIPPFQARPDEHYERVREVLSKLRFDRDENLAQITTYLTAINKATDASKHEVGLME